MYKILKNPEKLIVNEYHPEGVLTLLFLGALTAFKLYFAPSSVTLEYIAAGTFAVIFCIFVFFLVGFRKTVIVDKINNTISIRNLKLSGKTDEELNIGDLSEVIIVRSYFTSVMWHQVRKEVYVIDKNRRSILVTKMVATPLSFLIHKDTVENLAAALSEYLKVPLKTQTN